MRTERLGDHVALISGFAFKSKHFNTDGKGLPIVRIRDVLSGKSDTFYDGEYDERYVVRTGDCLIGMDGEFNLAYWQSDRALLNQRVCKIDDVSPEIDRGYLARFLAIALKQIEEVTPFVTVKHLSVKTLTDTQVPLPPLPEQKRIAAILDAADALRAKRRESIEQLDSLVQATFLEMFGDPVTNPKGWERKTLGEIIRFVGGSQPPKTTFTYEPSPDTVRLVQIRDFKTDEYKTYIPSNLARRRFASDDVMIARYGPPVFQILRGLEGTYNVALMKAEPKEGILKQFIFFLLSHPSVNRAVVAKSGRTAGQSGVNLDFLNNFPAYRPPVQLQNRFASIVESIEQQKARLTAHLAELDTLFASLQSRAFNGELVA